MTTARLRRRLPPLVTHILAPHLSLQLTHQAILHVELLQIFDESANEGDDTL